MIECADDAGGIAAEAIDQIFDPFVTTRAGGKGTGLGLSVAHGIISEMGGTISAANRDAGALFTIALPAAPLQKQEDSNATR